MKLDLLNKEIQDEYVRENFERIKAKLEAEQILGGFFTFFEVELTQLGPKVPIKHNLSFVPRDIIILSVEGNHNVFFRYEEFDQTNLYVSLTNPCRIRFLAGNYKDRAYGGSKKDFAFVSPASADVPTWFYGVGNPSSSLGSQGDFYFRTDTKQIYLKTTSVIWLSQGYLMDVPPSEGAQRLEISAISVLANVWTPVPTVNINKVADVEIMNNANNEKIDLEWRLVSGGSGVEIRSKKANTYTVHIEGYKT